MPRTKAQPVKKQRVSEEAALPLDDAALLAHAERVVQQLGQSAPARRLCLLRAPGCSVWAARHSREEAGPQGAQPLPLLLTLTPTLTLTHRCSSSRPMRSSSALGLGLGSRRARWNASARSTAPTAVGPNPNLNPNPNQVEQWEHCVGTPSSHIDFAAVPAAAAGLAKVALSAEDHSPNPNPNPKPNPNPNPNPNQVALSAEDHAVFRDLHDTIVDLHKGEGGAPAETAAQPVAAAPAPAAPAPTPGESEPAPAPEPAPEPAPAPAPAAASIDKAMAGWGGTDDRSGRQRCYGYVGTPLGLH
eukprot:scaffold49162_cov58-Phaeocystis_antarctica.AAC.2